ncbi:hypothetical protein A5753_17105 [Mycobacterium sp. 852002-51971_SCH5477799-a]|nr:hypothetical protein A5753_17105 [Mycobacterium sp. 852002-51971_SCH5477799-a]
MNVFVAQLHLPAVQPNTQPDRGQWCALQRQGAGDRFAGSGEGDHKTVAFHLFDGSCALMDCDDVRQDAIQPTDRNRHFVGLVLPQPRGA